MQVELKLRHAFVLIIALVLAACAAPPAKHPTPADAPTQEELRDAQRMHAQGDLAGAARRYIELAARAPAEQRGAYWLRGADLLLQAGEAEEAKALIASLPPRSVTPELAYRERLADVRLLLDSERADEALRLLRQPPPAALPGAMVALLHELHADAYLQLGAALESARERILLDPLLDADAKLRNQQAILEALLQLSPERLEREAATAAPDTLAGWLELAALVQRLRGRPHELDTQLAMWREMHPFHPAEALLPSLTTAELAPLEHPGHVALLLPLSGRLAGPGAAVRDGFIAAYFADNRDAQRPVVRIYDVGDDPARAVSAYEQAVYAGAGFVVGPLGKDGVAELARAGELRVPVLALNTIDSHEPLPAQLFQFGLSPEDEAHQVAERARADGHARALALVPAGSWGERLADAFRTRWRELGGELLEIQRYDPESNDYSDPIRALLDLDDSAARNRALRNLLQRDLKYEPRRRHDADFVFLAGFPRQARLMRPQLRFHRATDLPVYATSHIYAGVPDADADQDMDGVLFCDIPWLLRGPGDGNPGLVRVRELWPDAARQYARLYALGLDAYAVLPYLGQLRDNASARFEGETGDLYLDNANRVRRELLWARFARGQPTLLRPAPAPVLGAGGFGGGG